MSWSATIRTGNPETDQRTLDQHRAQAQQQGLQLHVQPLPHGGYYVQALAPGAAPQPSADAQFGGTLPSVQQQQQRASATPAPVVPMPGPVMSDPSAQFGGTLPSQPLAYQARVQPTPQVHMHPSAQYAGMGQCQSCGREGPTKNFTFMQNIGVVVIRFPKTVSGHLCKFCVDKYFFKMTLVTFFFGWWGVISFFYTLVSLPVNIVNRLRAIGMESPRDDAESVADKRSRGLWLILLGLGIGLLAGAHLLFVILMMMGGADVGDVVGTLLFGAFFTWLPALAMIISGIRDRLGASRAARELGIA